MHTMFSYSTVSTQHTHISVFVSAWVKIVKRSGRFLSYRFRRQVATGTTKKVSVHHWVHTPFLSLITVPDRNHMTSSTLSAKK